MFSDLIKNDVFVTGAVSTLMAILSAYFFFRESRKTKPLADENIHQSKTTTTKTKQQEPEKPLKNIFDAFRNNKSASNGNNDRKSDGKPFGSSYYYAHNNPNSTGGYKDGLRMEDYVMNGPRLLSVDGKAVDSTMENDTKTTPSNNDTITNSYDNNSNQAPKKSSSPSSSMSLLLKESIPINRYLWDDDADNNYGVAKVLIDTLPTDNNATIKWEDANISKSDFISKLIPVTKESSGLLVQFVSNRDSVTKKYHLLVPKLHGQVDEVKCIVKSKRLIIKIFKAKGKKFQIWPQLAAKDSKSTKDYLNEIDEDLFRNG